MTVYRIYIYDNIQLNDVLKELYGIIESHNLQHISVKKSYYHGFHLAVRDNRHYKTLSDFCSRVNILDTTNINYERIKKQIKMISQTEESPHSNFPLKKNGTIVVTEDNFLSPGRQVLSAQDVEKIEELETIFLSKIYSRWVDLTVAQQNIRLRNLWIYFASMHRLGVTSGYLAFKSNIEYFKEEIKDLSEPKRNYILNKIQETEEESALNNTSISEILTNKDFFKDEGIKFIEKVTYLVKKAIQKKSVNLTAMYYPDDFFDRHEHWSNFHDKFYHEVKFVKNYHSDTFVAYRLIIGILYSILPELNVSNLRKEKISGLVANKVETEKETNWKEVFSNAADLS
ncbi:MAG: hypothetical protein ABF786_08850 [Oenococcus oeni]